MPRRALLLVGLALGGCSFQIAGTRTDGAIDDATPAGTDASDPPDIDATAGRGRITSGLIALYELQEGAGAVAADTSGVTPALDLVVPSNVAWTVTGLRFDQDAHVVSNGAAMKIHARCAASNEITVETWFEYGALPGWSRIIALSESSGVGNAAMTSDPSTIGFDLNTTTSTYERSTMVVFSAGPPVGLHHMVNVRDAAGTKVIYLDGQVVQTFTQVGTFGSWNTSYGLSVGNTPALDRPFIGRVHLVAIYDRALSAPEVATNRAAGADP